jgi:PAS domain S-box-containing protein
MSADRENLAALTEELRRFRLTVAALEEQAAESRRSEQRLAVRDAVTRALSEYPSLADAAPHILRAICETLEWRMGALWVVEQDRLRCVEVWHRPHAAAPKFEVATRAHTFSRGEGMPGRVWELAQPAWIPDVTHDVNFPRSAVAAKEGLRSSLGFPIAVAGEVVGVMEFFSGEIREPDQKLLDMLGALGSQIGQFIERKHAEEMLDRFFTLSLDMLCIATFDGRFLRLNPAWQRTLGYSVQELTESPFVEFVHPDDRAATVAEMEKLVTGEQTVSFENRYRARDGSYRWMLWTATPFARDRLVYAAARDITERKRAEEKIQRLKEAAEAANRAKSDFLARMSHEMRTPLTAIIGMGDVLDRTALSSEQRQYLASLQRAGGHLLALINDLLDLSKAESDHLTLENIDFSLFEVLEKTAEIIAVAAREKGVALRREVAPDIPAMLTGDPGRLRQVLINLVGNAIKFTSGGQVVIRVERDPDERDPCALRFSVADTGVGIPEDKLGVIFEAFAQADASTTRQYGGTGLGLAIAKRFIEIMGGHIWVESRVGAGSTFHFTARFGQCVAARGKERAAASAAPVREAASDADRPLRILVAEDSEDSRFLLETYLKEAGHLLDFAGNGELAVEKFRSGSYDLVLMDVQMPVLDGYAATRQIRAWEREHARNPTPVVALTAYALETETAKAAEAGCTSLVTKPIKFSELMQAIEKYAGCCCLVVDPHIEPKLRGLIPGYIESRRRDLQTLRAALEASDYEIIRDLGHKMSGTGGAYGLPRITEIGLDLEKAAREHDPEGIRAQTDELARFLARAGGATS